MHTYISLTVLRCCLGGDFTAEFLTAIVLGVIVARFIEKRRINFRLAGILLALYVICEGIATGVYHGHLPGLLAIIIGLFSLGIALGILLFLGFDYLWNARKKKNAQQPQ